jgi:hypothetical protein
MLKYFIESDGFPQVKMNFSPPLVYLDTWAINDFVDNPNLFLKFKNALQNSNGTLCISIMTIYEIVNRTNIRQIQNIASMLDQLNWGYIDSNPIQVCKRENKLKYKSLASCVDEETFKFHVTRKKDFHPFTTSEIITELANKFQKSNFEKLNEKLTKFASKPENKKMISQWNSPLKKLIVPSTRDLWWKVHFYILNSGKKMTDTEWIDVFHLIVPCAYCDFVLLDKKWTENFIKKIQNPQNVEIAKVFWRNKLELFIKSLNEFWSSKNTI